MLWNYWGHCHSWKQISTCEEKGDDKGPSKQPGHWWSLNSYTYLLKLYRLGTEPGIREIEMVYAHIEVRKGFPKSSHMPG